MTLNYINRLVTYHLSRKRLTFLKLDFEGLSWVPNPDNDLETGKDK